jgi:methylmalonyl-CoA mutase C-terminal domain/subunit
MNERPPKVVVTKIGFDGHDRGSRVVAATLRDAGMEVVYTPPWQDIAAVVKLALEEDVDVIGISSLASDHLLVPKLMAAMREARIDDIAVIVGGIVPPRDEKLLLEAGVARVFHPGASLDDIVATVRALTATRRAAENAEKVPGSISISQEVPGTFST